jgi:hypothetical protein
VGLPSRVTKIGWRVLRAFSRTPRQVALSSEIAIASMNTLVPWSTGAMVEWSIG